MPEQNDMAIVEDAANTLGEHFDSVMIFCTRHESATEGGTINVAFGVGNWYARYGQTKEWLLKQEERSKEFIRNKGQQ